MKNLKKLPEPKEKDEHRHVFLWAQRVANLYPGLELLNASMNGAWIPAKTKAEKALKFATIAILKGLGCIRVGFPDINLPVARGGYHGLYIELKRRSGGKGLSEDQQLWLDRLNRQGYLAVVAWGADAAIEVILGYLELRSKNHEHIQTDKRVFEKTSSWEM